jgi:uncharacterized protein
MSARLVPAPEVPPALRLADRPLPPYRFVPGHGPHPFRHPDGHAYTDGSAPDEVRWDPDAHWTLDTEWLRGLDLFEHRYWWEAHEAWEAVWHQVPRGSPYSELLQGLIQIGAALLKAHMGSERAAGRLLARGWGRLEKVIAAGPDACRGLDLAASREDWQRFLDTGEWPPALRKL